jgi:hypothetical protein
MKRLIRIISNGLAVMLLMLCVETGVLWVRSYRVVQEPVWIPSGAANNGYGFQSASGKSR